MHASLESLRRLFPSRKEIVAGIDVGSYHVRAAVAEKAPDRNTPILLGRALAPSRGLRHGYIINKTAATKAVRQALETAQEQANERASQAFVGVGGVGLDEFRATGEAIVSRADQIISAADLAAAQEHALEKLKPSLQNYAILHAFPISYTIDGKQMPVPSIEGMRGNRIAVDFLFIASIEKHLSDLIEAVQLAGVDVAGVYSSPIAAAYAMLSREQRHIGAALANIGAHTLSLVVFEKDTPISLKVFPVGSSDITNDIALALQIEPREAELLKIKKIAADDAVRERVQEISQTRVREMFQLIDQHLQSINRSRLLPGGIVITGGGSATSQVQDIARSVLALPARIGLDSSGRSASVAVRDASWAVAYGVIVLGMQESAGIAPVGINPTPSLLRSVWDWLRGYLP
ncbi:hypothetical protein D6792_01100 [Candidatus Parcubacteria bacterium]|nr:MAG: hypothetical protein D6792_01100 [Candidatus Parcubacteria bacterium]GIW69187.1 MAG: cell division protein FtsA [Candidatus Parcubacteria bacterium]